MAKLFLLVIGSTTVCARAALLTTGQKSLRFQQAPVVPEAVTPAAAVPSPNVSVEVATTPPRAEGTPLASICGCQREAKCTCQGSFEYLQCVTKACAAGCAECEDTTTIFSRHCALIHDECVADLTFGCTEAESTCTGNFHQAADGTAGLTLRTEKLSEKAFCGPNSKCLGELQIEAETHRLEDIGAPVWLECALPMYTNAAQTDAEAWTRCSGAIEHETYGSCIMPMVPTLDAGASLRGSCWLVAGEQGSTPITQPAHFIVQNIH